MSGHNIFKYPLPISSQSDISLPLDAKLLHVGEQNGEIFVWALVAPSNPMITRSFTIYGTGHPVDNPLVTYVGTVQMRNGLVWHVFVD